MPDGPTPNLSNEIRRRMKEYYKRSLYALIPFALTTVGVWAHAPRPLIMASFLAIWVGIVICMVSVYQLSRCPACNHFLAALFQLPRCPHCHVSFRPDKT
jgi:hypothetical protein